MDLPYHIHEVLAKATCLYTKTQVEAALDQMAGRINHQLAHTNPIFLCVVLGGIVPLGNLLPRLNFPLEIDYVHASRYHNDLTGKNLIWKSRPTIPLENRTVIVVDDILDGGITLKGVLDYVAEQKAKNIYSAVLVDKVSARLSNGLTHADFTGLTVDNHYVFGYGMDYKGYLRNAPGIYRVAPEHE
ncbi:MAG: hypoxanthine-guanine phosphoribosyltransferase [Proteobacteria bacterium]|nr:hypoxanthine-guanine phosphoribosyltransferase [Pseudomonadota bacterium]